MSFLGKFLAKFRSRDAISKKYIANFLPDKPTIVEAGAASGKDTLEMIQIWPEAQIYAFEPVPESYEKLCRQVKGVSNITTYRAALGSQAGQGQMFVSSTFTSSSLLMPKEHLVEHPRITFPATISVLVETLDDWASQTGVEKVDFLWLDMQGNELACLQASPNILQGVEAIYMEVFLKELYSGAPLYPEVKRWLGEQGFQVQREELSWRDAGNVLFVRVNQGGLNRSC